MCRFCLTSGDARRLHTRCDLCSRLTRKNLMQIVNGPLSTRGYTVCPDCKDGLDRRNLG